MIGTVIEEIEMMQPGEKFYNMTFLTYDQLLTANN